MLLNHTDLSACHLLTLTTLFSTENTFTVIVEKDGRGLGMSVCGGGGLVRIRRLYPPQPAWRTGRLAPRDLLLSANGVPLAGLSTYVSTLMFLIMNGRRSSWTYYTKRNYGISINLVLILRMRSLFIVKFVENVEWMIMINNPYLPLSKGTPVPLQIIIICWLHGIYFLAESVRNVREKMDLHKFI